MASGSIGKQTRLNNIIVMKLQEAKDIIKKARAKAGVGIKSEGFRIHFEKRAGGVLASDYFPDRGEKLIKDEEEAWKLAREFASATDESIVNVYVTDHQWRPVQNYNSRRLKPYLVTS